MVQVSCSVVTSKCLLIKSPKSIHVPDVCQLNLLRAPAEAQSQRVVQTPVCLPNMSHAATWLCPSLSIDHARNWGTFPPKFNWNPQMAMINKNIIFQTLIVVVYSWVVSGAIVWCNGLLRWINRPQVGFNSNDSSVLWNKSFERIRRGQPLFAILGFGMLAS